MCGRDVFASCDFPPSLRFDPKYVWDKYKIIKNDWVKMTPQTSVNLQDKENIKIALDKICSPLAPTNLNTVPFCQKYRFP